MNYEREKMLLFALETTYNVKNLDEYRNLLKKKIIELYKLNMRLLNN